jgi:hypothetical protein
MATVLAFQVFGLLFGREWFVEPGAAAATITRDILVVAGGPERADRG